MKKPKSSALLVSPNLGCPEVLSPQALLESGLRVVIATRNSEDFATSKYTVHATPSFASEGRNIEFELTRIQELNDEALPLKFDSVGATRLLITTTLRTSLFPECTFWAMRAKPRNELTEEHFRAFNNARRSTLYDLALALNGVVAGRVPHALCLRANDAAVKFVHLTDLHLAARNDLWQREVRAVMENSPVTPGPQNFQNFNGRFREFIRWANKMADDGELDFVWALGDLVDFCRTGLFDRCEGDTNWPTFLEMVAGSAAEAQRGNAGLRVPIFTSTGNHDWRPYPYSPAFRLEMFGITKKCADELDVWYRNAPQDVANKLEEVNERLVREGSPFFARSWWGTIASMGLRGLSIGTRRLWQRAAAVSVSYSRRWVWLVLLAAGVLLAFRHPFWALILFVLAVAGTLFLPRKLYAVLRKTLEMLIAIEADVSSLEEYFLRVNPYLNYAFEVGHCAFIVIDTGPDCLTAQSFWDDGGKKIRNVSIHDNILGGSPDTMGFYPANEFYPYSQIAWLENVLACLADAEQGRARRVFVGLHAPVANLSLHKRQHADGELQRNGPAEYLFMKEGFGGYDIRYGTANHYLSQFFYLCLGCREAAPNEPFGPGIDAVFSGHAHWNLEFKLQKPQNTPPQWHPEIFYGEFSKGVEAGCDAPGTTWGPLLLQTAACGPQGAVASEVPPNFRYVTVNPGGGVCHLRPLTLQDGSTGAPADATSR
ncbi:MAG TPA: metallophosphoesterase [Terriglobales bacterium]